MDSEEEKRWSDSDDGSSSSWVILSTSGDQNGGEDREQFEAAPAGPEPEDSPGASSAESSASSRVEGDTSQREADNMASSNESGKTVLQAPDVPVAAREVEKSTSDPSNLSERSSDVEVIQNDVEERRESSEPEVVGSDVSDPEVAPDGKDDTEMVASDSSGPEMIGSDLDMAESVETAGSGLEMLGNASGVGSDPDAPDSVDHVESGPAGADVATVRSGPGVAGGVGSGPDTNADVGNDVDMARSVSSDRGSVVSDRSEADLAGSESSGPELITPEHCRPDTSESPLGPQEEPAKAEHDSHQPISLGGSSCQDIHDDEYFEDDPMHLHDESGDVSQASDTGSAALPTGTVLRFRRREPREDVDRWAEDTDLSTLTDQCLPEDVDDQKTRHYVHERNPTINHLLTVTMVLCITCVVGLGVGHFLGWLHHQELTEEIVHSMDVKLDDLKGDLMTCLITEEDQDLDNKWIKELLEENEALMSQLQDEEQHHQAGDTSTCTQESLRLRDEVNQLRQENEDLRSAIAKMRYGTASQNGYVLRRHWDRINQLVTENSELQREIRRTRYMAPLADTHGTKQQDSGSTPETPSTPPADSPSTPSSPDSTAGVLSSLLRLLPDPVDLTGVWREEAESEGWTERLGRTAGSIGDQVEEVVIGLGEQWHNVLHALGNRKSVETPSPAAGPEGVPESDPDDPPASTAFDTEPRPVPLASHLTSIQQEVDSRLTAMRERMSRLWQEVVDFSRSEPVQKHIHLAGDAMNKMEKSLSDGYSRVLEFGQELLEDDDDEADAGSAERIVRKLGKKVDRVMSKLASRWETVRQSWVDKVEMKETEVGRTSRTSSPPESSDSGVESDDSGTQRNHTDPSVAAFYARRARHRQRAREQDLINDWLFERARHRAQQRRGAAASSWLLERARRRDQLRNQRQRGETGPRQRDHGSDDDDSDDDSDYDSEDDNERRFGYDAARFGDTVREQVRRQAEAIRRQAERSKEEHNRYRQHYRAHREQPRHYKHYRY